MEAVKIFLIRNTEGKFLHQNSTPRIGVRFSDINQALFFPTESQARGFIESCCKQNNTSKIIDCMIIEGEFIPKEGYKAIDEVLKSKRMKALYDLMKAELSVAELLLFTAASDRSRLAEHPIYEKIEGGGFGVGFESMKVENAWKRKAQSEEAFEIFKKLAFVVMKDKAKEQK